VDARTVAMLLVVLVVVAARDVRTVVHLAEAAVVVARDARDARTVTHLAREEDMDVSIAAVHAVWDAREESMDASMDASMVASMDASMVVVHLAEATREEREEREERTASKAADVF